MDAMASLAPALAGRYTIERMVGRGGMATVYLARDLRHDRLVALKVLDPELGAVLGGARFLSEIKVTANLQHPNLLPLFDSGEAAGLLYYVMPFIDGESLRGRLERDRQLTVEDAVRIATSIASALQYAHSRGVIHRDLKPENVLLHGTEPIVADFGIALAVSNAGGARVTQTGLSLGTPMYMSPEQATGDRTIDGRSDVYSLGAITYEMLVGEPPHTGSNAQAIIARLITERPRPVREARPAVSDDVDAAVMRALEKLPADRWSTAGEFRDALLRAGDARSGARPLAHARKNGRWPAIAAGAFAGSLVGALVAWNVATRAAPVSGPAEFELDLPTGFELGAGVGQALVFTPDGRSLVYRGGDLDKPLIYRRDFDDIVPHPIPGTSGALQLVGSPDGRWISFVVDDTLWKVPLSGGPRAMIASGVGTVGAAWGPGDMMVLAARPGARGLSRVPAAGGAMVPLTSVDSSRQRLDHRWPHILPDGKTVLFTSWPGSATGARIGMVSVQTGRDTVFDLAGSYVLGLVDGHLIYAKPDSDAPVEGSIMAVPIDIGQRRLTGEPITILSGVAMGPRGPLKAAYSADGMLVFQRGALRTRLSLTDSLRRTRQIEAGVRVFGNPRFSPDGKRVAFSGGVQKPDIWTYDMTDGATLRLTSEAGRAGKPEWTWDGTRILYQVSAGNTSAVWWQAADGSGRAELLQGPACGPDAALQNAFVTRAGFLVCTSAGGLSNDDIWARALSGDSTWRPIATTRFNERSPSVSPNGRWIALASDQPGVSEVYVQAFPNGGARYPISIRGGTDPKWSADDRRLFYRSGRQLVVATIQTEPFMVIGRDTVGTIEPSSPAAGRNYDVSSSGQIVSLSFSSTSERLSAIVNWLPVLKAKIRER